MTWENKNTAFKIYHGKNINPMVFFKSICILDRYGNRLSKII